MKQRTVPLVAITAALAVAVPIAAVPTFAAWRDAEWTRGGVTTGVMSPRGRRGSTIRTPGAAPRRTRGRASTRRDSA